MTIELPMRLEGYPMVQRLNSAGEVVETIGPYRNTITYSGMSQLFTAATPAIGSLLSSAKVGTGTTPIAASDAQLPGHVTSVFNGSSPTTSLQSTTAPYYIEFTKSFDFPQGALVGTFGCVGVSSTTGTSLHAGSLIKDTEGNPTTITLTSEEQLRLTYRIRAYAPPATSSGTIHVNDVPVTGTIYTSNFNTTGVPQYGAHRGIIVASLVSSYVPPVSQFEPPANQPGGNFSNLQSVTSAPYTFGANYRDYGCVVAANAANFSGGIRCLRFSTSAAANAGNNVFYDFVLDTPIMKTNLQQLSLQWRSVLGVGPV